MGCGSISKVNKIDKISEQNGNQVKEIEDIIQQNHHELQHKQISSDDSLAQIEECTTDVSNLSPQQLQQITEIPLNAEQLYNPILQFQGFSLSSKLEKTTLSAKQEYQTQLQQKRIQREIQLIIKNLPIFQTHSIFVRCNQSNISHFQSIIVGSKDTPYSYGVFLFDIFCNSDFPNSPPKMSLITTGNGSFRFNPNLYIDGYICLSILGTWSGNKNELWNESTSSILQILLSIQSLVMSEDVYYNEPSVSKKVVENEKRNRGYSNLVKIGTIRYAMIQQLTKPPLAFKEVIQAHFYIQKNQILDQCNKWIIDSKQSNSSNTLYDSFVKSHNSELANRYKSDPSLYEKDLLQEVNKLKLILDSLKGENIKLCKDYITHKRSSHKSKSTNDSPNNKEPHISNDL